MEYSVVFDVAQNGYRQWWFPAIGLIPIAVGIVLVIFRRRLRRPIFPFVWLGFAVFWTGSAFAGTVSDYLNLVSDLRNGRCVVVEGIVADLHPMPPGPPAGYKADYFTVGGVQFKILGDVVSAGFNQMQSRGGPLREGMQVRIHYVGDEIARLEIAR